MRRKFKKIVAVSVFDFSKELIGANDGRSLVLGLEVPDVRLSNDFGVISPKKPKDVEFERSLIFGTDLHMSYFLNLFMSQTGTKRCVPNQFS